MFTLGLVLALGTLAQADAPLRIDSIVPHPSQPEAADPAVIWFDDFDGPEKTYTETPAASTSDPALAAPDVR